MLEEMTGHVKQSVTSKEKIMMELANTIGLALSAHTTKLYLVESEGKMTLYRPDQGSWARGEEQVIGVGGNPAQQCATQRRTVLRSNEVRLHFSVRIS